MSVLNVQKLSKSYNQNTTTQADDLRILQELDMQVQTGETVAIWGPSGCGKTTLLGLLAGMDEPSSGDIILDGISFKGKTQKELTQIRSRYLGIVFQQFHLMPHLTAIENIALPLDLMRAGTGAEVRERSLLALTQVGLAHRSTHFPHQLSGGECQRVAIARALVVKPKLLLADEPSGNLDEKNARNVMDLLFDLVAREKTTLLLVTHNESLAKRCDRILTLEQGRFR